MNALLSSPQFKRALFDVQTAECERYAAKVVPVIFSTVFERKMDRLIQAHSKPYYHLVNTNAKKVILALAATFILMITMIFSVSALREPVVRFLIEVYEKFSQVFIHQQQEAEFPAILEVYYAPSWLPEGYREDAGQAIDATIFCEWTYVAENKVEIKFKQYTITSPILAIDTEDIQAEPCLVKGNEGLYYSNKGIQHLIWNDEQYGFHVTAPISEADLLRIADSILPLKK